MSPTGTIKIQKYTCKRDMMFVLQVLFLISTKIWILFTRVKLCITCIYICCKALNKVKITLILIFMVQYVTIYMYDHLFETVVDLI